MSGSTAVSIVSGIVKSKLIALLLGPGGIGQIGLLQALMGTAATIAGAGLGNSAVREVAIARAAGDQRRLAELRRTLWGLALLLALLSALALVLLRHELAQLVLGDRAQGWMIACLGLGVAASTISGVQIGWINGQRQIGVLARITLWSSLASLPLSIGAVWLWGTPGLVVVVIAPALLSLVGSWRYSRRAEPRAPEERRSSLVRRDDLVIARQLLSLGSSFMLTALLAAATQLVARLLINQRLGLAATGQFQAAWSVSMLYVGFALGAMAADYYPRLSEAAGEPARLSALINQQALLVLYLLGPIILIMFVAAPLLMRLLYSGDFADAAGVLRWQVAGDLFKAQSWAFGFALLARRQPLAFLLVELGWNLLYLALLWLGLEHWGLQSAGVAFLLAYSLYDGMLWMVLKRSFAFSLDRLHARSMLILVVGLAAIMLLQDRVPSALIIQSIIIVLTILLLLSQVRARVGPFTWRRLISRS